MLSYGRACYGWARAREKVQSNPFEGLPIASAPAKRDRVLSDIEIGLIWRAAGMLGWPWRQFLRLLLVLGQRRDEVAGMRWAELASDRSLWTIPAERSKNSKAHIVRLPSEARTVLAEVPRLDGCPFVFSTTGRTPISGFSVAARRLDAAIANLRAGEAKDAGEPPPAPLPDWRWHDIRRTMVTWLAGAGFPPHVADKLLNHTTTTGLSDVARVYQRAEFLPERKAALEAWARMCCAVRRRRRTRRTCCGCRFAASDPECPPIRGAKAARREARTKFSRIGFPLGFRAAKAADSGEFQRADAGNT